MEDVPSSPAFDSRREPMAVQLRSVAVTADLTIAVSRDADGTLAEGARTRLAGADAVHSVETFDATGISPGLNDVEVEATAAVEAVVPAETDAEAEVRQRIDDVFGISVHAVDAE